ncbi:MAG: WYL domain-containing protein [Deltaproteobacteria bacterium]|nr:WYL domain-containing protein [Deltaproteobacteria bacterium]
MSALTERLRRALFLVPYLARRKNGVTLDELADIAGTTRARLDTELNTLMMVGRPGGTPDDYVTITREGTGTRARFGVLSTAGLRRPPRLTSGEGFALLLGLSTLKDAGIPALEDVARRVSRKIEKALRGSESPSVAREARIVIERDGTTRKKPGSDSADGSVVETLERARKQHRVVELDYSSLASQRRKVLQVEPYGLLNHTGFWYLVGKSLSHGADRPYLFKVERILSAKILEQKFTTPSGFKLEAFVNESGFVSMAHSVRITLRVEGETAKKMRTQWKKVRSLARGGFEVTFKEHPGGWLTAWILRQGADVTVVEPPELQKSVAIMARNIARAHE